MLNFTGVGSAYNPELGSNSAYIIKDNSLYIFDCGETVFGKMKKLSLDFRSFNRIVFLITHTHSDHIGSLASFVSYLYHVEGICPTIVHPNEKIPIYLAVCGIENHLYKYKQSDNYRDKVLKTKFYTVTHVDNMNCYGILCQINKDGSSFYYSGDASTLPEKCLNDFNAGKIDYWYQDVTINIFNHSHFYYEKIYDKIDENRLDHVYCMHLEEDAAKILIDAGLQVAQIEI
ncbi:MAG: MBL fold metallo-hydrolase [Tissierellia bacterium]|nr:MBL fold metallo-hydrolase [Tissierellia bacterium]